MRVFRGTLTILLRFIVIYKRLKNTYHNHIFITTLSVEPIELYPPETFHLSNAVIMSGNNISAESSLETPLQAIFRWAHDINIDAENYHFAHKPLRFINNQILSNQCSLVTYIGTPWNYFFMYKRDWSKLVYKTIFWYGYLYK